MFIFSLYCGQIDFGTPNLTVVINILNVYETKSLSNNASYARSCYIFEDTSRSWQDCFTFPIFRLSTKQTNTPCLFEADISCAKLLFFIYLIL